MRAISLATFWLSLGIGCSGVGGPELATVSGTVTLDRKPLPNATVMFQPANGRPSFGRTDSSGNYILGYTIERPGAMIGGHTVNIRTQLEDDEGRVVQREFLPRKYHDKTELSADVEAKANVIDFHLSSKSEKSNKTPNP